MYVPLSPVAKEIIERMRETYPTIASAIIGSVALEMGLRQLATPSGPPSTIHLPIGDGY